MRRRVDVARRLIDSQFEAAGGREPSLNPRRIALGEWGYLLRDVRQERVITTKLKTLFGTPRALMLDHRREGIGALEKPAGFQVMTLVSKLGEQL